MIGTKSHCGLSARPSVGQRTSTRSETADRLSRRLSRLLSSARVYTNYELTHDLDAGLVVYSWLSRGRRVRLQWAMIFHSPSVHLGDVVGGIRAARARGAAPSVHRQKAR